MKNINDLPAVSIILPSFNHKDYIEESIGSVFNQTFKNFELIVIDDGSKDGSDVLLKKLQNKFNFQLIIQENIGVAATLNKGIKHYAKGEYITFCSSDDYWLPNKLEKQVRLMEENLSIQMCFGKALAVDENGVILNDKTIEINRGLKGGDIFENILLMDFHPPVNQLFRKKLFDQIGLYPVGIWTEDFYMNLKISQKYEIGFIPEFISAYRIPSNSIRKFVTTRISDAHKSCIDMYKESMYYPKAIKKWHYRNLIWYSSFKEHKKIAINSLFYCKKYFYKAAYIKAIIKLIFIWR
ncbi:glycosyltransferase [Chromobacterium violaceum]|uniref:glycosyltransferase family 2 protein n=2 Tax=Chromobacterium violaceum TaxID=536 RepID=UPI001B31A7B3|nr:glycosyltransferase [Chromobacterium violaceum]MBP4050853.1 glycosyltransferase [Chromobacterium violaceum]